MPLQSNGFSQLSYTSFLKHTSSSKCSFLSVPLQIENSHLAFKCPSASDYSPLCAVSVLGWPLVAAVAVSPCKRMSYAAGVVPFMLRIFVLFWL